MYGNWTDRSKVIRYSPDTSVLQEEKKELDEITAKRQKRGKIQDEAPGEEKTILHSNICTFS